MLREESLVRVQHPDTLRLGAGRELSLISDPLADRLSKGDPTFGWEGDNRLALYFDLRGATWVLVRLERDGQYRVTLQLDARSYKGHEAVAEMIARLTSHDTRRGFDPHLAVVESFATRERRSKAKLADFSHEAAERIAFGLRKDIG